MTRRKRFLNRRHQGFTVVELLVVIGLILFLMSISIVALSSALGIARQRATQATIQKIHGLMQQRVEAFNRALDRLNLQPADDKMKRDLQRQLGFSMISPPQVSQILVRKQIYMQRFPQNFSEAPLITNSIPTYQSGFHNPKTESAAVLYWILTKAEIYGIAPVDESEFSSTEVRDTDGDGLPEFVDGWGRPLRYYRWPTHLFRPGDGSATAAGVATPTTLAPIDRSYVSILWSGLPAPPTAPGSLDPLTHDPDDPTNALYRFASNSAPAMTLLQNLFHTPGTYHAFLIVSAGPDNNLGMGEPYEAVAGSGSTTPPSTTTPALGTIPGAGRLAALTSYALIRDNPINDNLTNRKRQ